MSVYAVRDPGAYYVSITDSTRPIDRHMTSTDSQTSDQWLPALLLLFVGSGAAALIYEIVWFQMLEL
jgi:hypothetical protein